MKPSMVTTAMELPGWEIVENMGLVRGVTVRSRSIIGNFGASIQSLFGGNITLYSELCEDARVEAYQIMVKHAQEIGADGVIAMRYDATEMGNIGTEVLAYGTAVKLKSK